METSKYFTKDLIPTNGVYISPSFYPAGFTAARHDDKGFTSDGRWFPTLAHAETYADKLAA